MRRLLVSVFIGCGLLSVEATAQTQSLPLKLDYAQIVTVDNENIGPTTPLNTPLYRRGPLAPITQVDGVTPVTLEDFDKIAGNVIISAAEDGSGTSMSVEASGLVPGWYSVWAGYWRDPGFPSGERVGFGAVTDDGMDNWKLVGDEGTVEFEVFQPAGPMSVVAATVPPYAPTSPIMTPVQEDGSMDPDNMREVDHAGYTMGIAYHFGEDFPTSGFAPGDPSTWVIHGTANFVVPEPTTGAMLLVGMLALVGQHRRRMKG